MDCGRRTASTSLPMATCSTATTRASGSRPTRCATSSPASSTATRRACAGSRIRPMPARSRTGWPAACGTMAPSRRRRSGTIWAASFPGCGHAGYPARSAVHLVPLRPHGQDASEPVWDTTGGKFGPFVGPVFRRRPDQCQCDARGAGEGERRLSGGVLSRSAAACSAASIASASRRTAA